MKKINKIFFAVSIICLAILAFSSVAMADIGDRICTCTEIPSALYSSYYQCQEVCGRYLESVMPPTVIFKNNPVCPSRTGGGCDCSCRFSVVMGPYDECTFAPPGYEGNYNCAETIEGEENIVDIGDSCANQNDCISSPAGSGGDCSSENYCYCDLVTGSSNFETCRPKIASGNPCQENYQCASSTCRSTFSGEEKVCIRAGLTPPTGNSNGAEETPPLTEGEVFPTYQINSPIGEVTGPELIGRIVKTALTIVGSLALAMFVYGGFIWLTSGGSTDKIKEGKDILMWATIGLIVIFASYTLVDFLLRAFGA